MDAYEDEKLVIKGTAWQFFSSLLLKFSSFFYVILLSRMFLQEEVGLFYLALSIVGILTVYSDFGVSHSLLRYLPYFRGRKENEKILFLVKTASSFAVFATIISASVLFLTSPMLAVFAGEPKLETPLKFFFVYIIFNEVLVIFRNMFFALRHFKETVLAENAQNIFKLLFTFALAFLLKPDALTLILALTLATILTVLFYLPHYISQTAKLERESGEKCADAKALFKEIAPYGFFMSSVIFVNTLLNYVNTVLLGYLLVSDAAKMVAIYSISIGLTSVMLVFAKNVKSTLITVVSEKIGAKHDKASLAQLSSRVTTWIMCSLFLFLPILLVFPKEILLLFYGYDYTPGETVLFVSSISLLALFLSFSQRVTLDSLRYMKTSFFIVLAGCIANIIFGIILIPEYGINGAAFAMLISYALITILSQFFSKQLLGHTISLEFISKYFVAGLASILLMYLFKAIFLTQPVFSDIAYLLYYGCIVLLGYVFSIALFFLLLIKMQLFDKSDFQLFALLISKFKSLLQKGIAKTSGRKL